MYGCHNKPRPNAESSYVAQFGWHDARDAFGQLINREPIYVEIKSAFGTTACQSDRPALGDPDCIGCINANMKGGEK